MRQVFVPDFDDVLHRGDTYMTRQGGVIGVPGVIGFLCRFLRICCDRIQRCKYRSLRTGSSDLASTTRALRFLQSVCARESIAPRTKHRGETQTTGRRYSVRHQTLCCVQRHAI